MNGRKVMSAICLNVVVLGLLLMLAFPAAAESERAKTLIYDHADLLSDEEESGLRSLAVRLGAKRETDFIILTLNGTGGMTLRDYVAIFYDDNAPGYDQPHGNAAILAIDLKERDVVLAGFGQAETRLDAGRLDNIRKKITPYLSDGEYYEAFERYIKLAHDYMGFRPGVNPDNILFKTWFQAAVSVAVAGIAVGVMAMNAGGRITVNARTYLDGGRSGVVGKSDRFMHKTVTRTKIEKPSSGGKGGGFGGGGGGGITPGGRSFSSSSGKF